MRHARLLFLLLASAVGSALADAPGADAPAAAWIVQRDARVLKAHRADEALPVASLVKLLTAVLWLQKPERLAQVVAVSARAAAATGARAGLRAGERYTGADLLSALLVRSANDACLALAEQASGSVEAFVADLGRAAELLGLRATRIENPCGWDAPGQRSSARDVLAMAQAAMELPAVRERVAMPVFTLRTVDGKVQRELRNTNLLLGQLPGTRGVKTGFTAQAGKCLVALAERDGVRVWLVLLGAGERWWTAHRAIESAFGDGLAR
jgi:D-alanyl-D-alanine carboxypeptidase (penicillin-binding protein 5/6)